MYFGRGANKVINPYTFVDMYKFYIDEIDDNSLYKIKYNEYVNIVGDYIKLVMEYLFEESGVFNMSYNLGKCSVIKKNYTLNKVCKEAPDWKTTNELGKKVIHLNEHSRGKRYGFYWDKRNRIIRNINLYRLVFTRYNKRHLAKLIKSGDYDYYEKI